MATEMGGLIPQRWRAMPSALRSLGRLGQEFDELWQSLAKPSMLSELQTGEFLPAADIREGKKEFVVRFDVPGVRKEDIDIEVDNGRLTVRGERREVTEEKEGKVYCAEASYGQFVRTFMLPAALDEEHVLAECKNGVLTIRIPKSAEYETHHIKIN